MHTYIHTHAHTRIHKHATPARARCWGTDLYSQSCQLSEPTRQNRCRHALEPNPPLPYPSPLSFNPPSPAPLLFPFSHSSLTLFILSLYLAHRSCVLNTVVSPLLSVLLRPCSPRADSTSTSRSDDREKTDFRVRHWNSVVWEKGHFCLSASKVSDSASGLEEESAISSGSTETARSESGSRIHAKAVCMRAQDAGRRESLKMCSLANVEVKRTCRSMV